MSTGQIVQLADSLVKGWETRIPAMKFTDWDQFRWWLNGVSLDIENYCTLRLFFDLVDLN